MYCRKCGKQINDSDKFCPHCGASCDGQLEKIVYVRKYDESAEFENRRTENRVWGALAVLFAIFIAPLGLLFSIIGLIKYNDPNDPYHGGNKAKCIFGLIFSGIICSIVIWAVTTQA